MSELESPRRRGARKVSVFALAMESASVQAEISMDDVLKLRPGWSSDQAKTFLRRHTDVIGQQMVIAGATLLLTLIEGSEQDVN
jgi:hypothetical protein